MDAISERWHLAEQPKLLFGLDWKLLWKKPLVEIRASLNIKLS